MTTIAIKRDVKEMLVNEKESRGESIDSVICRLIESSTNIEPFVKEESANIRISAETLDKLKALKSSPMETHSDTILRLLNSKE